MRTPPVVLSAFQTLCVLAGVAAITALDFRLLHINATTVALTYLLYVLALATRLGLWQSVTASVISAVAYNYFFLPPVGTFAISDPQNWIAFFAFLATATTASQLSSNARIRAAEARARQEELQQMYDFSRGLILGKENCSLTDQIARQVSESFGVETAWFYETAADSVSRIDGDGTALEKSHMAEVAGTGNIWRDPSGTAVIVPVRLGGAALGSLGVTGKITLSEVALQSIAQLVAIAIERARAQQVATRTEAARQNEQLKSTLLDALAHEFKTPLTSVKAAATTLLSSCELAASERRELLTIVDEEADRMTRLVNDSIEFARMGTAPLVLHPEACDAEKLIRSALADMRGLFEGRETKVTIAPNLPKIFADKRLSELALRQVLNNALKYSRTDSEIRISAEAGEGFLLVKVFNHGASITREDRVKIFEKFYRGAAAVRSRIPGTGMGLTITREIVEAQGGRISVASNTGDGTTFAITLPFYKEASRSSE